MCISVSRRLSQKAKLRKPEAMVVRYKILMSHSATITSPIKQNFVWKIGLNKSNVSPLAKLRFRKKFPSILSKGIHVFVKRSEANAALGLYGHNCKVVAVQCRNEDLVIVGSQRCYDTEVYTQVTISKREYEKVLKA